MNGAHKARLFPRRFPRHSRQSSTVPEEVTAQKPRITVAAPHPLLDPGEYVAICTEADCEWAKRFCAWKARLSLVPQNYSGRPYIGTLCKFFDLRKNPQAPYAGLRSAFRMLWVEVNGEQPTRPDVDMSVFEGKLYRITVETVVKDKDGELLLPPHWYSVVRKIRLAEPSEPSEPFNLHNLYNQPTEQPSNRVNLTPGQSKRCE